MSVKLKPTSEIKFNLGIDENGRVLKFLTNTCKNRMEKYVPYRDGDLRASATIEGNNKIVYNSPYAHYMYKGELYVDPDTGSSWAKKDAIKVPVGKELHYNTPGTGAYWDLRMMSAEKQQIIQEVQNYIKRG